MYGTSDTIHFRYVDLCSAKSYCIGQCFATGRKAGSGVRRDMDDDDDGGDDDDADDDDDDDEDDDDDDDAVVRFRRSRSWEICALCTVSSASPFMS